MTAIDTSCAKTFRASKTQGARSLSQIRLVVLHVTAVEASARTIARNMTSASAGGSSQLVVDDDECYRVLPNDVICQGAAGANTIGVHIEHCGSASRSRSQWLGHRGTLRRGAFKTALHCRLFGLPPRYITAAGLARNLAGVTTHADVNTWAARLGLPGDHSHTCPWPSSSHRGHWPMDVYMQLVREFYWQRLAHVERVA